MLNILKEQKMSYLICFVMLLMILFINDFVNFFDEYSKLLTSINKWNLINYLSVKRMIVLEEEFYTQYVLSYCVGRYYIVCSDWINNGKKESKEEIILLLIRFNHLDI